MKRRYSIFHIQGGLGKHIAATAVAKCIKNNHPDRDLIVVCPYTDIFINLKYVDRVYPLGQTQYFYQNYVENKDSIIFYQEPYFTTDHIHKRLPLIENWCKMYGLKFNNEKPDIVFNKLQKEGSKSFWVKEDKPVMVLHTNGGLLADDAKPYMWARDMPFDIAQQIVNHYSKDYTIYQSTKNNSKKLDGAHIIEFNDKMRMSMIEYLSILLHSDKRVLIDSCLQHAAAALDLPSVVLWNATSPKVFGYDIHTNIETVKPQNFKLPGSYLFDFDFIGSEFEYPFDEDDKLYDIDTIINAIDTCK
jgi:hypothetical protein